VPWHVTLILPILASISESVLKKDRGLIDEIFGVRSQVDNRIGHSQLRLTLEIAFSQDLRVVRHVPGPNVGERANRELIAAGDAASRPRLGRQRPKERDRREPNGLKFLHEAGPGSFIRARGGYCDILVEAG
jgi:hypothetical protein